MQKYEKKLFYAKIRKKIVLIVGCFFFCPLSDLSLIFASEIVNREWGQEHGDLEKSQITIRCSL